jgi:hypothetical protein
MEGLKPAAEAAKTSLLRRVTFDLTGLPPTPDEVDAFVADPSPDAYEKAVDRLLKSPRFGEQMTRFWLDAARYGDTHGLHLDNYREIWPYRDWVIRAFNDNKPFDRFIVEQLAGDLLSHATLDQQVATGYNRCHVTTSEGGSIDEEVYVRNVVDQVDTNGTVFLGLSVGCSRCHDHKYDPIRQKDYYQLFAFFNNVQGPPHDGNASAPPPAIRVPTPEQRLLAAKLEEKIATLKQTIVTEAAKVKYDDALDANLSEVVERGDFVWIDDNVPVGAQMLVDGGLNVAWKYAGKAEGPVLSGLHSLVLNAEGIKQNVFTNAKPGLKIGEGDRLFAYVYLDPLNPPKEVMLQWFTTNWLHRAYWGENLIPYGADNTTERHRVGDLPVTGKWVRLEVEAAKVGIKPGTIVTGWAFTQQGGTGYWDKSGLETWTPQEGQTYDTLTAWIRAQKAGTAASLAKPLQDAVAAGKGKRTPEQVKLLRDQFLQMAFSGTRQQLAPLYEQIAVAERERQQIEQSAPTSLVFKESPTIKPAFLLKRGEYDRKGDEVGRDTPAFLPPLPPELPRNRLGFAEWLVAPNHPLTARVAVNRFWQQCFGTGIVKTAEDFGTQGERPSHPELLDWLAVEFQESGWNVKKTMKTIVMSATYRQASQTTREKLAKDPQNRLLARGPRYRLDAEMLRDQALLLSGLLAEKVGGPPVKPPQPSGLWEAVGYVSSNTRNFMADTGPDKVYRRSLYTFWKRTAPPPIMSTFDAPSRESCLVRRERTNTPLQALLLLNDRQYVECARVMAERGMKQAGSPEARAAHLFKLATGRNPDTAELTELVGLYRDQLAIFEKDAARAQKLIGVGERKPDPSLEPADLAAWTMVANTILNLDEVITKG